MNIKAVFLSLSQVTTPTRSLPSHLENSAFQFWYEASCLRKAGHATMKQARYINKGNRTNNQDFLYDRGCSSVRILPCWKIRDPHFQGERGQTEERPNECNSLICLVSCIRSGISAQTCRVFPRPLNAWQSAESSMAN